MKRFVIFVLLFTYGLTASAATFSINFCCGNFHSISWTTQHSFGCCANNKSLVDSNAELSRNCCTSLAASLKACKDQLGNVHVQEIKSVESLPAYFSFGVERVTNVFFSSQLISGDHSPPGIAVQPGYILYRIFRV